MGAGLALSQGADCLVPRPHFTVDHDMPHPVCGLRGIDESVPSEDDLVRVDGREGRLRSHRQHVYRPGRIAGPGVIAASPLMRLTGEDRISQTGSVGAEMEQFQGTGFQRQDQIGVARGNA